MLELKFGKSQRAFPIKLVSDAKITEEEVNQYVTAMKAVRQVPLSKREASRILRKREDLVLNYTYTDKDIENNLKERKKKGKMAARLGLEQTRAAIAVQGAREALEEAKRRLEDAEKGLAEGKVSDLKKQVEELEQALQARLEEENQVLQKVMNRKQLLTERTKDRKWAKVNRRAVVLNQKADQGAQKEKEQPVDGNDGRPKFNPYARRKVKPKILWEVGQQDEKEGEEKASEAKKDVPPSTDVAPTSEVSTPALVQEQLEKAAVLNQSHQFAIDEEVLAQSSFTKGIAGLNGNKVVRKRVRRGLSLTEYQERKTAGTL